MTRSQEAMQRRAEKRNRTVDEQRRADAEALRVQRQKETEASRTRRPPHPLPQTDFIKPQSLDSERRPGRRTQPPSASPASEDNPLEETGAWICSGCGNHNFASRRVCHSQTCDQKRPGDTPVPARRPSRHAAATSKPTHWLPQADAAVIETNQALRQRYVETQGEGMTETDRERAMVLIARDERKKEKKALAKKKVNPEEVPHSTESTTTCYSDKKDVDTRKANTALRKRYMKTRGDGMIQEEIARAKILIARDERKRQRREEVQGGEEQPSKKGRHKQKTDHASSKVTGTFSCDSKQ
jgi:hypothetical protein